VNFFTKPSEDKTMKALISCVILISTGLSNRASAEISTPDIKLVNIVRSYADRQLFANPIGIYYDSRKSEIYLADAGNHQIGIFDSKGTSVWKFKHWVTEGRTGERQLGSPHSVVVTPNGDIIVSDNQADYLDIFDYRGTPLQRIEPSNYENIKSFRAAALALDFDGNLYIGIKVEASEIIKLDQALNLVLRFGEKGDEPHNFANISGITIGRQGQIYVSDLLSDPVVKVFSASGEFIQGFGGREENKGDFSYASGIAVVGDRLWVVDGLRQVVKCLTLEGQFITMVGGLGFRPGDMNHPSAVASDGDTLLFVAERLGNRFQQFIIK
jgi:DNA-binding beta-propeller fold protein YncE